MLHHYQDLIDIFNSCFYKEYNTKLVKGDHEPSYLPATEQTPYHSIVFAHGFFSSALHECAHWLIAGPARRQLVDYGYWYEPDGRTLQQQILFEQVEVKPQALESIFSSACKHRFQVSIDNLNGNAFDRDGFIQRINQQVQDYHETGLPKRALKFYSALCDFYKTLPNNDNMQSENPLASFFPRIP